MRSLVQFDPSHILSADQGGLLFILILAELFTITNIRSYYLKLSIMLNRVGETDSNLYRVSDLDETIVQVHKTVSVFSIHNSLTHLAP